jgi:hypothetical protein
LRTSSLPMLSLSPLGGAEVAMGITHLILLRDVSIILIWWRMLIPNVSCKIWCQCGIVNAHASARSHGSQLQL